METNEDYQFIARTEDIIKADGFVKGDLVIYYANEKFYCFSRKCPHMPELGDLSLGEFCPVNKTIKCAEHRFTYCVKSGIPIKDGHKRFGALDIFEPVILEGNLFIKTIQHETVTVHSCSGNISHVPGL